MSELEYVSQTLTKAISSLRAGPGRIREDMKAAYAEWHPITVDKLPDELRDDWQSIIDRLTVVKDDEKGHVLATIDSLSEKALIDIATDIMKFTDRVDASLRGD